VAANVAPSRVDWCSSPSPGSPSRGAPTVLIQKKASRSGGNGGQCVEVARIDTDTVAVRDSKDPDGPVLRFRQAEWEAFLDGVTRREFDCI
jgi:hypothetical protein